MKKEMSPVLFDLQLFALKPDFSLITDDDIADNPIIAEAVRQAEEAEGAGQDTDDDTPEDSQDEPDNTNEEPEQVTEPEKTEQDLAAILADPAIIQYMRNNGLQFKSVDQLINSYRSLNGEFTKRSQRLNELEKQVNTQNNTASEQLKQLQELIPQLTAAQKKDFNDIQKADLTPEEREEANQKFLDDLLGGDTKGKLEAIIKNVAKQENEELRKQLETMQKEQAQSALEATATAEENAFYANSDELTRVLRSRITEVIVNELPESVLAGMTMPQLLAMARDMVKGRLAVTEDEIVNDPKVQQKVASNPDVQKQAIREKVEKIQERQPPRLMGGNSSGQMVATPVTRPKNMKEAQAAFNELLKGQR